MAARAEIVCKGIPKAAQVAIATCYCTGAHAPDGEVPSKVAGMQPGQEGSKKAKAWVGALMHMESSSVAAAGCQCTCEPCQRICEPCTSVHLDPAVNAVNLPARAAQV